jgi:hypothetical protein
MCAEFGHCDQTCTELDAVEHFSCGCLGNCLSVKYIGGTPISNITTRGYCVSNNTNDMYLLVAKREGMSMHMRQLLNIHIGLYNINPNTGAALKLVESPIKFIYGIDYDYARKTIFWSERDEHVIYTSFIEPNGTIKPESVCY